LKLGKKAMDAYEASQAGASTGASSLPAGYAVASDGGLINTSTGAYQVGTAEGGGALMSDGTTVASAGSGGTPGFSIGTPSYAGYVGAAMEAPSIYNATQHDSWDSTRKAQEAAKHAGLAVASVYTGGLASLAYNLAMKTKLGQKIDSGLMSLDRKLGPLSPNYALGAAFSGMGMGKSTGAYQAERRNELANRVKGYGDYINAVMGDEQAYRDKYKDKIGSASGFRTDLAPDFIGVDQDSGRRVNNAFANSLDKKDLQVEDVWGSNGVFDTFGDDWMNKYTYDQRKAIAQKILEESLFDTDKGDVVIFGENQDRAKQIRNEILGIDEEEKDGN
jgi:hypothetical protein